MDKFSSKVHRVHMELGGKLLNSLRIETQFLERLQSVSVVDGAANTQKDDVESNGGSLENVAKVFVLFLCGVQLVLRSGVLTHNNKDPLCCCCFIADYGSSALSNNWNRREQGKIFVSILRARKARTHTHTQHLDFGEVLKKTGLCPAPKVMSK
jgi:hypothetical protein